MSRARAERIREGIQFPAGSSDPKLRPSFAIVIHMAVIVVVSMTYTRDGGRLSLFVLAATLPCLAVYILLRLASPYRSRAECTPLSLVSPMRDDWFFRGKNKARKTSEYFSLPPSHPPPASHSPPSPCARHLPGEAIPRDEGRGLLPSLLLDCLDLEDVIVTRSLLYRDR